ncbi:ATP/GTP-binding protein [Thermovibrio ammonificans HB-1]|uniref:ATP/GTP-binding protein n=1 Tax=Thermovibrio ammonificans (strain DSM 15698 / JCM 12110 / HB-1) TaxID=648996 RepID=E8T3J4_THEA1|nr:ATP/GTP-binding protein [Thermovibrio ammonificans]ADU96125.1 ATP/GTP-binding protein [Thermovibrio ammonificans HB-1]
MGLITGAVAAVTAATVMFSINQGIKTPESAQGYMGKIYISNIGNLPPDAKDGDGYITLADLNGRVVKQKFVKGLNAPKGITFCDGKLFVADIDRVVVADPSTGKVIKVIPVEGARFLNDTASNGKSVFVSDTQTNSIYEIDPKTYKVKLFIRTHRLEGPNGIDFAKDGKMIVVSWGGGKVLQVGKEIKVLASGFKNLDGVVVLPDGSILFSDFSAGKVYRLKNGKVSTVVSNLISPADIGYYRGVLLIPEFMMNTVKAVRLR